MSRPSRAGSHDEYLAALPAAQRAALEKLRRIIRTAAPDAEECTSYRLPAFCIDGKVLVLYGASAGHCSFFPGSGTAVDAHRVCLEGYHTSKGTIRFAAEKPLPASVVRRIVKYRIAENERSLSRGGKTNRESGTPASQLITERIAELGGWRGKVLRRVRKLITKAAPGITEEWKWNNPVWSHHGIICTGESYKTAVKLTFARGASLQDPATLFNASLGGRVRRAIDIHERDELDESAFQDLVRAAVLLNRSRATKGRGSRSAQPATGSRSRRESGRAR